MLSDSAFWRIQNDTGREKTFPAKYTQHMLREVAGAGIVGEDGYTMRVGYVATHPTNNVETPTEQPLLRRAKPVGAVRACLQFGGSAPFPLGLGQLAQRERGWGEGSNQLKNWNFGSSIISLTPSPTLPRAPRKMCPHFAWVPARCGPRPAGEEDFSMVNSP